MKKSSVIWLVVIIIVIVVALGIWYWSAGQSNFGSANVTVPSSTALSSPATTGLAEIIALDTTSTTALGTFLVATNGMTLYKYTEDAPGVSNCTGQCAVIWPPYTVSASEASSSLVGIEGATGQVGVITRADGSYQVTYNGTPLYFYDKDGKAGDTNGQNVGGVWFVVSP